MGLFLQKRHCSPREGLRRKPPTQETNAMGYSSGTAGSAYSLLVHDNPSVCPFGQPPSFTQGRGCGGRRRHGGGEGGFFVLLRSDPSSVSCADTFPHGEGFGVRRKTVGAEERGSFRDGRPAPTRKAGFCPLSQKSEISDSSPKGRAKALRAVHATRQRKKPRLFDRGSCVCVTYFHG